MYWFLPALLFKLASQTKIYHSHKSQGNNSDFYVCVFHSGFFFTYSLILQNSFWVLTLSSKKSFISPLKWYLKTLVLSLTQRSLLKIIVCFDFNEVFFFFFLLFNLEQLLRVETRFVPTPDHCFSTKIYHLLWFRFAHCYSIMSSREHRIWKWQRYWLVDIILISLTSVINQSVYLYIYHKNINTFSREANKLQILCFWKFW